MDKSYKKPLLLITFGVILFAAFNNLNYVANFLKSCIGLLAPILSGLSECTRARTGKEASTKAD
jgi:hypothetical protein